METTVNLVKSGNAQLVDMVDDSSKAVLVALRETNNALVATAHAAIQVEDQTVDNVLDQAEVLRQQYMDSVRKVFGALVEVVPGVQDSQP